MKTSYKITLNIDETKYELVVRELTKQEAKKFKKEQKKLENEANELTKKEKHLARLRQRLSVNEAICKKEDVTKDELKELNELYEKVYKAEDECEGLDELKSTIEKRSDELLYEKLTLTISGKDGDAYLQAIEEKGVDIRLVFVDIAKAINKVEEKK